MILRTVYVVVMHMFIWGISVFCLFKPEQDRVQSFCHNYFMGLELHILGANNKSHYMT